MAEERLLGILDCDELAEELRDDYVSYTKMFSELLLPYSTELKFKSYKVLQGGLPCHVEECDAYLVTGSKTGVYDGHNWISELSSFLGSAYDSAVPLLGICFGHQLLAHSLGGHAAKSEKGWGVGAITHESRNSPNWMGPVPSQLTLLYSHQDQVQKIPSGCIELFGSEFCPYGAFWERGKILSFQGHPEFTKDYSQRLMSIRQALYAEGQYETASASLNLDTDEQLVAQWMMDFIEGKDLEGADPNNSGGRA